MVATPLLRVPYAFTGDTSTFPLYPTLSEDTRLVNGSLVLLNPNDPDVPSWTTTPASGDVLVNLAWQKLAALLGEGDEDTLGCQFTNTLTAPEHFAEVTPKKGLHICVAQGGAHLANHYARIALPTPLLQYILDNPTHDYYVSYRGRGTRLSLQVVNHTQLGGIWNFTTADNNHLFMPVQLNNATTGFYPLGGSQRIATPSNPLGSLTSVPYLLSKLVPDWSNTPADNLVAGAVNSLQHALFMWGSYGVFASRQLDKARSDIFYGFYMEDLTVSGRSYATVDAADLALYTTEIGGGGALNGDSFTAVATLP